MYVYTVQSILYFTVVCSITINNYNICDQTNIACECAP